MWRLSLLSYVRRHLLATSCAEDFIWRKAEMQCTWQAFLLPKPAVPVAPRVWLWELGIFPVHKPTLFLKPCCLFIRGQPAAQQLP